MRTPVFVCLVLALLAFATPSVTVAQEASLALPAVQADLPFPLEKALKSRRSIRKLSAAPLTKDQLSRLLWAAQGVTDEKGHRTVPSARATYPIDVYALVRAVDGVPAGVYRYVPDGHRLEKVADAGRLPDLDKAVGQEWTRAAPVALVVTATAERAWAKMGERAGRFCGTEAGLAAQNVLLEQVVLGLAGTYVGGFDLAALSRAMGLAAGTEPWAVLPCGKPAE